MTATTAPARGNGQTTQTDVLGRRASRRSPTVVGLVIVGLGMLAGWALWTTGEPHQTAGARRGP